MNMEFNFILPENFEPQSVKHLLEKTWLVPRKQRYFLRLKKHCWVNGVLVSDQHILVSTDRIKICFDSEDFSELFVPFGDKNLADLIYEDDHVAIANKPEGMKTHGNEKNELGLQNHVAAAVGHGVFVVHRLDQSTSGAVLFAKNQFVLPILGRMFEENLIHREYLALVHGHFSSPVITIDQPIGKNRHDKRKQIVTPTGKRAVTHLSVLTEYKKSSLIKLTLDTGRTHQIRVHLSALTAPIFGDLLYGNDTHEPRLMLHAQKISWPDPFTGEMREVLAPSKTFDARCQQEQDNQD